MNVVKMLFIAVFLVSFVCMASHNWYLIPDPDGYVYNYFTTANGSDDYFFFPDKSGAMQIAVICESASIFSSHKLILYKHESGDWVKKRKVETTDDTIIIDDFVVKGTQYRLSYDEPAGDGKKARLLGMIPEWNPIIVNVNSSGEWYYSSASISPAADIDWYYYTSPSAGTLSIDTDDSKWGFDTNLYVYTQQSNGEWSFYRQDIGDADNGNLSFSVSAGQRFAIGVSGSPSETGAYTISIKGPVPPDTKPFPFSFTDQIKEERNDQRKGLEDNPMRHCATAGLFSRSPAEMRGLRLRSQMPA